MKFLPYENYILITKLKPEEIKEKLRSITEPKNVFRPFSSDRELPYEGQVFENAFNINRITGRNSFLPIIEGKILKKATITEIHIKMRMAYYTYIISLFIFGPLLIVIAFELIDMLSRHHFYLGFLALIVFTLIIYSFVLISFKIESAKSKKFFNDLLDSIN